MSTHQRYVVQKGDCLWNIAARYLGSPWEYQRIFRYNNRESIKRLTGRFIDDADLIYPNQILYIPALPGQAKPAPVKPPPPKPKSLMDSLKTAVGPYAAAYKLEDLPMMVYETPAFRATVKLSGKIAVRLADSVPVVHVTNRGLESRYLGKIEGVINQLFYEEAKVEFDKKTNKIKYRCLLVSNNTSAGMPSTAIGLAVASDKPVPVLRGEIRFPKIKGYVDRNFYFAENVRVVIEIEPKVVNKPPERLNDPALVRQPSIPVASSKDNTGTWILIGSGVVLLTATILTDFLGGVGIADDVITIPAALRMIGTGAARIFFPVVVRQPALALCFASHHASRIGPGMALAAAH